MACGVGVVGGVSVSVLISALISDRIDGSDVSDESTSTGTLVELVVSVSVDVLSVLFSWAWEGATVAVDS